MSTENNTKVCAFCGRPFIPKSLKQKYCSVECRTAEEYKRSRERNVSHEAKPPYHWLTCPDCGAVVWRHVKSKRCEACQIESNKADKARYTKASKAGHTRKIGDLYPCEKCGKLYALNGGKQRYCTICAPIEVKKNVKVIKKAWRDAEKVSDGYKEKRAAARMGVPEERFAPCLICGNPVSQMDKAKLYCSDECKAEGERKAQERYAPRKKILVTAKYIARTEEQRQQANAKARENYAKRMAKQKEQDNGD